MLMRPWVILMVLVLTVTACSTTTKHEIDSENANAKWNEEPYDQLAIVSVTDNRSVRIANESVFVDQLRSHGVEAHTTYDLATDLSKMSSNTAIHDAMSTSSADAILAIAVVESAKAYKHSDWYETYGLLALVGMSSENAARVADIGDTEDYYAQGKLALEITLFDARTLEPVWTASTRSYEMDEGAEGARKLADFMVEAMLQRGYIRP